jgi:hypothetical protein
VFRSGERDVTQHFDYQDAQLRAQIEHSAAKLGLELDELRDEPAARQRFNPQTMVERTKRP